MSQLNHVDIVYIEVLLRLRDNACLGPALYMFHGGQPWQGVLMIIRTCIRQ